MCFKQNGAISTFSDRLLNPLDQVSYIGKNISSTESNVNIHLAKAWNGNCTIILRAVLNKIWMKQLKKLKLHGHLHSISQTTQVIWRRHNVHFWKSKDELMGDVLLLTTTHGDTSFSWAATSSNRQFCANIRYTWEIMSGTIDVWDGLQKVSGNLKCQCYIHMYSCWW